MNSMSRGYNDSYGRDRDRDRDRECPTIIKCGSPSFTPINNAAVGQSFIVASLNLDTSCICNPSIKLEFASNIIVTDAGASDVGLTFRVFKQCRRNQIQIPVGPVWSFFVEEADFSTTFSFFVCDSDSDSCDEDEGCCTYTVVATVTDSLGTGNLFVNNATLGAIATCKNSCRKCRRDRD